MCPRIFVVVVATTTQRTQRTRGKASNREPEIRARTAGTRSSRAAEGSTVEAAAAAEIVVLTVRAATTAVSAAAADDVEVDASRTTSTVSHTRTFRKRNRNN